MKVFIIDIDKVSDDDTIKNMDINKIKRIGKECSLKDFEYLYNKEFIDTINTYIKFVED